MPHVEEGIRNVNAQLRPENAYTLIAMVINLDHHTHIFFLLKYLSECVNIITTSRLSDYVDLGWNLNEKCVYNHYS